MPWNNENRCLLEHGVFLVKNTQIKATEDDIDQNSSDRVNADGQRRGDELDRPNPGFISSNSIEIYYWFFSIWLLDFSLF